MTLFCALIGLMAFTVFPEDQHSRFLITGVILGSGALLLAVFVTRKPEKIIVDKIGIGAVWGQRTIPLPRLNQLLIHTATANVRQIEYFLTYALSYMGQNYLKDHVA